MSTLDTPVPMAATGDSVAVGEVKPVWKCASSSAASEPPLVLWIALKELAAVKPAAKIRPLPYATASKSSLEPLSNKVVP